MKAKHIFIQPETDAALSKLGGKTRAENLRRAVALAEVAGELAEALEGFERGVDLWLPTIASDDHSGEVEALHLLRSKMLVAITTYRSAKNVN